MCKDIWIDPWTSWKSRLVDSESYNFKKIINEHCANSDVPRWDSVVLSLLGVCMGMKQ
jgi:hypothetical protein